MKCVLLVHGGGGTEHQISRVSAQYIYQTLQEIQKYKVIWIELDAHGMMATYVDSRDNLFKKGMEVSFDGKKQIRIDKTLLPVDFVIPCIHGYPGETGEFQALLEHLNLPYLGCGPQSSMICFNKITCKLWLNAIGIPNTPFEFLANNSKENIQKARATFEKWQGLFVKAASQGSSVGCYPVYASTEIEGIVNDAFKFSSYVLLEKKLVARELEISAFEMDGEVKATVPGEIIPVNSFYSFDEKYSDSSKTQTVIQAKDLNDEQIKKMRSFAIEAFKSLQLKDLSRIDFFLTNEGDIYLNEINTFPGMTPISMFPKMMEASGLSFKNWLEYSINKYLNI